jgi:hypothetical protein
MGMCMGADLNMDVRMEENGGGMGGYEEEYISSGI